MFGVHTYLQPFPYADSNSGVQFNKSIIKKSHKNVVATNLLDICLPF